MKTKFILLSMAFLLCQFTFDSCKKEKSGGGSKTSANGGTESHNVGEACMSCHNSDGSNEYWWIVAGTVYNSDGTSLSPNGTVYLYSASNGGGTLVATIPVDGKANFYTTNSLAFGNGLFPAVKSLSGHIKFMNSSISQGNCNGCHGSSNRITVN
jgi:hypothetical protein